MTEQNRAQETRVRDAVRVAFAENATPTEDAFERIAVDARERAAHAAQGADGPSRATPRWLRHRTPAIVAAGVVGLALIAVIAAQLAAPWDSRVLARAAASAGAWRQPGMITHFIQETEFVDPVTSKPSRERREVWANYDGTMRREVRSREGTPSTFVSIFDPRVREGIVARESSSTEIWNDSYTSWLAEMPEGVDITVDHSAVARHTLWSHLSADPCSLCHAKGRDAKAEAARLANRPPYLAAIERGDLKVVGKGEIGSTPTYVLRAEAPLEQPGYTEVTTVEIDRDTYQPVRYRIQQVHRVEGATPEVTDTMTIRVLSHELVAPETLPPRWFELVLPVDRPWAARETFSATETVSWPPPGTEQSSTAPAVYDLGRSFVVDGALVTGIDFSRMPASTTESGPAATVTTGTPPAFLEVLQRTASATDVAPSIRTIVEYGELTPSDEQPRWSQKDQLLDGIGAYAPLIWVITLPAGSSAWGLAPEGSVVVERPDATVVITAPTGRPIQRELLRAAAAHLNKRQ